MDKMCQGIPITVGELIHWLLKTINIAMILASGVLIFNFWNMYVFPIYKTDY